MAASDDQQSFRSFSFDDELAKARWYHEDLKAGGWRELQNGVVKPPQLELAPTFWIKTFPDQEIPTKVLFKFDRLPLSAIQFTEVLSPRNTEHRRKWDKAFAGIEVLEEYPENGGHVTVTTVKVPRPLSDRETVLFTPPTKEIDWYGKSALHIVYINAWHASRPANERGFVRATNGGNFFILIPDENDPDNVCSVFGLSHNRFNGRMPNSNIEWLFARSVPKTFITFITSIVEGHKKFFLNKN